MRQANSFQDGVILVDLHFLNQSIQEVYQLYPHVKDKRLDLDKLMVLIMKQVKLQEARNVQVYFFARESSALYNCTVANVEQLQEISLFSQSDQVEIVLEQLSNDYLAHLGKAVERVCQEMGPECGKMLFLSDWNCMDHRFFSQVQKGGIQMFLGRLDNERTQSNPDMPWFEIQALIVSSLDIDPGEPPEEDSYFDPPGSMDYFPEIDEADLRAMEENDENEDDYLDDIDFDNLRDEDVPF